MLYNKRLQSDHLKETLNTISNTKHCPSTSPEKITLHAAIARRKGVLITSCMNLLQTARISLLSVALNIITCFSWGVLRKISWTSLLMSETSLKDYDAFISRCQNKEFIFFPMVKQFKNMIQISYQELPTFCHIHQEQSA